MLGREGRGAETDSESALLTKRRGAVNMIRRIEEAARDDRGVEEVGARAQLLLRVVNVLEPLLAARLVGRVERQLVAVLPQVAEGDGPALALPRLRGVRPYRRDQARGRALHRPLLGDHLVHLLDVEELQGYGL